MHRPSAPAGAWPASAPVPATVALASGMGSAALFVVAMLVGMVLHDKLMARP